MRTALQDADSVAGLLITTEATIGKPGLKGQATGGMYGGRIGETR